MIANKNFSSHDEKPEVLIWLDKGEDRYEETYEELFENGGWEVEIFDGHGDLASHDLTLIGFERLSSRPDIPEEISAKSLCVDFHYRREYAKNPMGFPFYLLDNSTVIVHDGESERFLKQIVQPVSAVYVMAPYFIDAIPSTMALTGKPEVYTPACFADHPWVKGMRLMPISDLYPRKVATGSFLVIPEYDSCIWPSLAWAAASGMPVVAPGTDTFIKKMFYGALLFDPESKDDFLLKYEMVLRRRVPSRLKGKGSFAVVVPRYEKNTAGGAENQAGQLAESLVGAGHKVEILTTRTTSMSQWNNDFPEGEGVEGGIKIRRFDLDNLHPQPFHDLGHKINKREELTWSEETQWLRLGVRSSGLENYIKDNQDKYDRLFFIPYLYGTTFWGSAKVPEKSLLIPCYHRESAALTSVFRQNAQWVSGILFNTLAEKRLAENELGLRPGFSRVLGEGVEISAKGDGDRFRSKYDIGDKFALYVGRFQREKNVPQLLECFAQHQQSNPDHTLAMVGRGDVTVEDDPASGVRLIGFLPEQDKTDAFAACSVFVLPSTQESFSIVLMEAWLQGRPALVNAKCDAAREHIYKCGGGLLYGDPVEFSKNLNLLLEDKEMADEMGKRGREYVLENFQWDIIVKRLLWLLSSIEPRKLYERLGEQAKIASRGLSLPDTGELDNWILSKSEERFVASPISDPTVPQLLDSLDSGSDISTDYRDFTHRRRLGALWSKIRNSITRHLRKNHIESLEGKQNVYNRNTITTLKRLYDEILRTRQR